MALRDYEIPTLRVGISETNDFTVRGISFQDISLLVTTYGPVMALLFNRFIEAKDSDGLRPETVGLLVKAAMEEFPELVSTVIAYAADERDQAVKIAKLPVGVQLDAIDKILRLTFAGEADIKNLVETVIRMAAGVQRNIEKLTAPVPSGNGGGAFARP